MTATLTFFSQSIYSVFYPSDNSIDGCDKTLSYLIAKILHNILPRAAFCLASRSSILLQRGSYWSRLADQVYLGGIPLENYGHLKQLKRAGVKAVLSINKKYEFQNFPLSQPVKSADWERKNITFLRISSPDLEPIELSKISRAVDFVARQIHLGNSVYIHCTGGRGRSATIAWCVLMRIYRYTFENAMEHLKEQRPQLMLSQKQINRILEWQQQNS